MQVAILGPLEVHDDGGASIALAGARLRGLIARLALAGGQPVSTGALSEAVWDRALPADVANALQTLVSRARRALGEPAAVEQSAAGYRLAVAPDDVDALRFERLVAEGSVAEALALWRGPALADAGDFAGPFARRLDELRLDATVTFLTREIEAGRAAARVGELETLVAEHPLHEKLTGLLVRALAATGRQADALAAYEALRTRLAGELGIDPGSQLRAVHLAVLRGEIAAAPGPAPAAAPAPVGRARTNLRAQLTSFVGRNGEVARLRTAMESYRLVTLVGPGGAGKTRLAAEVAAAVPAVPAGTAGPAPHDDWPDGIWMVELASVTDAADVPQAVLGSIGLRESRLLPDSTQLVTSRDARSRLLDGLADARALLVLDNCEHLIDACAHLADALLAGSPRLRIIATSREPLGITGESLFVVPPLNEALAVRLFADRATAVRPDFTVDDETRPLVADIVHRLDGLPLAIELAAARLRTLPLAEISSRLTDRFRLLTGGSRTALPRHRTLRAVVEWSWELLEPAERLLAERFSVFPAGATPAAVATVCAGRGREDGRGTGDTGTNDTETDDGEFAVGEADELLSSLVDKSLLQPLADGTRLRMLETIREYGAEKLAGRGEVGELRRRHAAHYTAMMHEAGSKLLTRDQLSWLAPLRADRDNILAALRYWCDTGNAENALSLALAFAVMSLLLGNDTDTAEWIAEALAVPGETDVAVRTIGEAVHVVTSAMDPGADGMKTEAYPGLTERLDAMGLEDYPIAGLLRPVYAIFTKDDERQRRYLEQARAARDEWLSAAAWLMTAGSAENDGNSDQMRLSAAEALSRFRRLGERWGLSSTLRTVGNIRVFDGDLDGADAAFTEASQLLAELGHLEDLSQVRLRLAEIAARRGDLPKARQLSEHARSAVESDGSPLDRGIVTAWCAAFEARCGEVDAARPHQAAAERHLTQFGPAHPARDHLEAMIAATGARIAIADKDLPAAREQAARSYRAAIGAVDAPLLAQSSDVLAELALALGQPEQAAELLGAGAVVRGADDPTNPTVLALVPLLRAVLGDDRYEACYASGRALARPDAIKRLDPAGLG